jgi:hypothetical protein
MKEYILTMKTKAATQTISEQIGHASQPQHTNKQIGRVSSQSQHTDKQIGYASQSQHTNKQIGYASQPSHTTIG